MHQGFMDLEYDLVQNPISYKEVQKFREVSWHRLYAIKWQEA